MKIYIKPPALSTSFSEDGKSAKHRFDNILNTKGKKTGVIAMALVLVLVAIAGVLVACNNNSETRSEPAQLIGTAIITRDAELIEDILTQNKLVQLHKNDLVYVIYDQDGENYYVQLAVMGIPATQGYVSKDTVSFETSLFEKANYGIGQPNKTFRIYTSPDESTEIKKAYAYPEVFRILERQGNWAQIALRGGDTPKWVKTTNICYDLIPHNTDLSYTELQKEVDSGHQPWRLDPEQVARDYLVNTLHVNEDISFASDDISELSGVFIGKTGSGKEIHIVVYQPVKKDKSGIWVVANNIIMQDKINASLSTDLKIMTNSGMGWRINIEKDMEYSDPERNIQFTLTDLDKRLEFGFTRYFGKDIDILMYDMEHKDGTTTPYIFIFDGTDLILSKDLMNDENGEYVKNAMIVLSEGRWK